MANHIHSAQPSDELDELVEELLACGAVLSQVVGGMIRLEAEGRSFPDAAPIPEVAHTLLREVLGDLRKSYSKRDVRVAASIVGKATETICEEIFIVDPDWLDEIRAEGNE